MNDLLDDIDLDDIEDSFYDEEYLIKTCKCGYSGPLIPTVGGFECENCGYLLVDRT